MTTNGHFASVGDHNDKTAYDNGVQVVDENKEFKYVSRLKDTFISSQTTCGDPFPQVVTHRNRI